MGNSTETTRDTVIIKKYANRRLYNTSTSAYVTLDTLSSMVKEGTVFEVYDARTGEEITRSVLTQIIVEEDAKGNNLLSVEFLRQLIAFSDDDLRNLLPRYFEKAMDALHRNRDYLKDHIRESVNGLFPFGPFDAGGENNVAFFDSLVKPANPSAPGADQGRGTDQDSTRVQIDQFRDELARMQHKLEILARQNDTTN